MDTKEISKGIKRIAERSVKQNADVQLIGVACIEQIKNSGNVTYLCDLYNALSKGDKDAFGRWALKFGGVTANLEKDTKARLPFKTNGELKETADVEGASATMWFEFQKEPTSIVRLLDEKKAFSTLMSKLSSGEGFKDPEGAKKLAEVMATALRESGITLA